MPVTAQHARRYEQFLERNPAYNGKFLTGVLTTGIYCLPSCPARRPKRENVRFFDTPDEAQSSGLRPCRRCRPDWFYRGEEWYENLFEQTIARVQANPAAFADINHIASAAGVSRTALNDLFREHAQESPASFLRRIRVEHVCDALERAESISNAAASAGFENNSTLHQQFIARTGLTPGEYADLAHRNEFHLRLPVGFRKQEVLAFYGRDRQSISERITPSGLQKVILIDGKPSLVEITFNTQTATIRTDMAPAFGAHRAAVRMLGLQSDSLAFEKHAAADELLGALVANQAGLRIPLTPDPWEALVWAIVGQQISMKFAIALRHELIANVGTPHWSGLFAHPSVADVASLNVDRLRAMKFSGSKAEYVLAAARAVLSGDVPLARIRGLSTRHAARVIGAVRGIGPWTIQYTLLRGFGYADCLPATDAGLAQGLERVCGERPNATQIEKLMSRYAPWRSFATYHVWASLKGSNNADEV
jgi:AraC family transcriptional regulator, regulatory protein of adaptative response / DNA-3-methyladenine glycosylase II